MSARAASVPNLLDDGHESLGEPEVRTSGAATASTDSSPLRNVDPGNLVHPPTGRPRQGSVPLMHMKGRTQSFFVAPDSLRQKTRTGMTETWHDWLARLGLMHVEADLAAAVATLVPQWDQLDEKEQLLVLQRLGGEDLDKLFLGLRGSSAQGYEAQIRTEIIAAAELRKRGVVVSPSARDAESRGALANASVPKVKCLWWRCTCLPMLVCTGWLPIFCTGADRHPSWDKPFAAAVRTLRVAAHNVTRGWWCLRALTDPPVGSVPLWLPQLPESVGCEKNVTAPGGGEWFFPAAGPAETCPGLCCADYRYPGDPQQLHDLGNPERVILYLHGGAFCLCSSQTHRTLLMRLCSTTHAVIIAPNYRRPPEHAWPVPVDDCLEAYRWLLEERSVSPGRIVLAGDSAGGGLVLSVMAAARARGLPLPACGVLWSPWVDLTDCCSGSWASNQRYDFLPRDLALKFALAYAGQRTLCEVSPSSIDCEGLPPLLVEVGDSECLRDQVLEFVAQARNANVDIEEHVAAGMIHVFPLLSFAAEDNTAPHLAYKHFADFVDRHLGVMERRVTTYRSECHACRNRILRTQDYGYSRVCPFISIMLLLVIWVRVSRRQVACDVHRDDDNGCPDGCTSINGACAGSDCSTAVAQPCRGTAVFSTLNIPEAILVVTLILILAAHAIGVFLACRAGQKRRKTASKTLHTSVAVMQGTRSAVFRQKQRAHSHHSVSDEKQAIVQNQRQGAVQAAEYCQKQYREELHHSVPGMVPDGDQEREAVALWIAKHSQLDNQ
jgi:monoterpene epsilon-lactone hydrolase